MILEGLWRGWCRFERWAAAGSRRLVEIDRQWARPGTLLGLVVLVAIIALLTIGWMALVLIRAVPIVGVAVLVLIASVVLLSIRDLRADVASMDMSDWDDRPPND